MPSGSVGQALDRPNRAIAYLAELHAARHDRFVGNEDRAGATGTLATAWLRTDQVEVVTKDEQKWTIRFGRDDVMDAVHKNC
jgi:hypothetical protein